jgi:hypothetical protein
MFILGQGDRDQAASRNAILEVRFGGPGWVTHSDISEVLGAAVFLHLTQRTGRREDENWGVKEEVAVS